MTRLERLFTEHGQSPWLDNLRRDWLRDGTLDAWIAGGVRGITSNPSIFQKAIAGQDVYDEQFEAVIAAGGSPEDAYWELVCTDIAAACERLRPVFDASGGGDGFVSVEVAPALALDTTGTTAAAADLSARLPHPNLLVKIPGTAPGLPAIRASIAAGISVNVTLLFSVERYRAVIDAYLDGLEDRLAAGADLSTVHSVASFFVSRVDTEVDRRLDAVGTAEAAALRGTAAVANAQRAYEVFTAVVAGERWQRLAAAGATLQRPLWASTSTKDPSYPDTLYVDRLIGPDSVNTLPEATLAAFEDHGTLARTIDAGGHTEALARLAAVGIDLEEVAAQLEDEGVAAFQKSFDELLSVLQEKAATLRA